MSKRFDRDLGVLVHVFVDCLLLDRGLAEGAGGVLRWLDVCWPMDILSSRIMLLWLVRVAYCAGSARRTVVGRRCLMLMVLMIL